MALKNINIFEQHVEKIVLAVAGAGAVFMMYLALQPITLHDNPEIGPKKVEAAIASELDILDRKRDDLERAGPPQPVIPDLVGIYKGLANDQPLSKDIINTSIADFGPHNLQPSKIDRPAEETVKSIVPAPAAPELVRGEALQLQVASPPIDPLTGQPKVLEPNRKWNATSHNVVVIDGYIPVGKMVLDMAKETDPNKRFTTDVQKGMVYRIHVTRQEQLPNGAWSKQEPVAPAKGFTLPNDSTLTTTMEEGGLPLRLPEIDAQFQAIQLPNYFVDELGQPVLPPILLRPIPPSIVAETAQLHNDIQAAQSGGTVRINPTPTVPVTPGTPEVAPMFPNTADQIKLLEVQPFTFWDDSVKPDHTYKYYVQVQLVNPGFGWKWGLADPSMKLNPVIHAAAMEVPGLIVVHSDMAFFIQGTDLTGHIGGQIFKQRDGRWYMGSFSVEKGVNISGQIPTGMGQPPLDVDTKFALVDYNEAGRNVHVILKDPTGNLVTRDSSDDWKKAERTDLEDKVKKAAAAAATAPAIDPVTGQPVVTPTGTTPPSVTPTGTRPGGIPTVGTRPATRPVTPGPVPVNR